MLLLIRPGDNKGKNVTQARFFSINHFGAFSYTLEAPKALAYKLPSAIAGLEGWNHHGSLN